MTSSPSARQATMIDNVEDRKVTADSYLFGMMVHFLRPYIWQLALVFLLLLGVTLLSLAPPYLIKLAIDGPIKLATENAISQQESLTQLLPYSLLYFGIIFAIFGLRFAYTMILQSAGQNALMDIRQKLFEHVLQQDMLFFNVTPVGQIVSRLSADIEALTELLSTSIVMVASNGVTLIGLIGVMLFLNWRLALLSLVALPIMIGVTFYYRKKMRAQSRQLHRIVGELLAYLNEQIGGMLLVQLFGRQQMSAEEYQSYNLSYRDTHLHLRDLYTGYAAWLQLLTSIGLAIMLYGGGHGVLAGWATLGMLVAFIQYAQQTFDPVLQLSEQFTQIQQAFGAGERIARMLAVEPSIQSPAQPQQLTAFKGDVALQHVTFSYEDDAPVLIDINVHIPAGQSIAIVGPTGAGKSSMVGLLTRFYDVQQGCIRIDGVDLRNLSLGDLRRYITVVPQNPYCFNGTVAENLRLFDETITDEQMIQAAHIACADQFIERLPGGYHHLLLPGGSNLSQGQRQLLALARALLHNPHGILVLDEATSSIDTETEALIQQGLAHALKNRTSVIIAHRLSTIREVDRILVLQRGRIVEDGSHQQLLSNNGLYAQLYRRQFLHHDENMYDESEQNVARLT